MTSEFTHRRENLRRLIEQWGGPSSLAAKLGYTNASFLVQMAGPHPIREVSEKTARKIEKTLDLPAGYLDGRPERGAAPKVSTELITKVVRVVGDACQDAGVKLTPAKFADLVAVVYQDAEQAGDVRGGFVKSLIQLTK